MRGLSERDESLWWLVVSPCLWLAHFLVTYLTVALTCAHARDGALGAARAGVLVVTAVALLAIALTARHAHARHRFGAATAPHDFDTPEDRHRFLGFAGLLLSAVSAIAVVFDALPVVFIGSCA